MLLVSRFTVLFPCTIFNHFCVLPTTTFRNRALKLCGDYVLNALNHGKFTPYIRNTVFSWQSRGSCSWKTLRLGRWKTRGNSGDRGTAVVVNRHQNTNKLPVPSLTITITNYGFGLVVRYSLELLLKSYISLDIWQDCLDGWSLLSVRNCLLHAACNKDTNIRFGHIYKRK